MVFAADLWTKGRQFCNRINRAGGKGQGLRTEGSRMENIVFLRKRRQRRVASTLKLAYLGPRQV